MNSRTIVAQADGKMLVFGGLNSVEDKMVGRLFRLNADGTLDTGFNYCDCLLSSLSSVRVLPDGKILVGGRDPITLFPKVARLFSNGTHDDTFVSHEIAETGTYQVVGTQSDGKVFVLQTRLFASFRGHNLLRLNADGSLDTSYQILEYGSSSTAFVYIAGLEIDNNGKVYIADVIGISSSRSPRLRRYDSNGTLDNTFNVPSITGATGTLPLVSMKMLSDGSMIIAGFFNAVNGVPMKNLARIFPEGNVDLAFATNTTFQIADLQIDPNDKLVVTAADNFGSPYIVRRFNLNGTLDTTFTQDASILNSFEKITLDPSGRVYGLHGSGTYEYFRLNTDGEKDGTYLPVAGETGSISDIAVNTNGQLFVAGSYVRMNGVAVPSVIRLNGDATIDESFVTNTTAAHPNIVAQPDGKLLILTGPFHRRNTEGSLDAGFSTTVTGVTSAAILNDGKILIGGTFTTVNGVNRSFLARLNTDGTFDGSFTAVVSGSGANVRAIFVQSDGKIMIGGTFAGVNGFNRNNLARLNSDGTLDTSFSFSDSQQAIYGIYLQPSGKYLLRTTRYIQRRNSDGTNDTSYIRQEIGDNTALSDAVMENDGSLIIGGSFVTLSGVSHRYLQRLLPNGQVDAKFFPAGIDGPVTSLSRHFSGKLFVAGTFTSVGGERRGGLAALDVQPVTVRTAYDYDGDGKADVTVFRPADGFWYLLRSSDLTFRAVPFGMAGDIPVPGDYDGDDKYDVAIFRPSSGDFWSLSSMDDSFKHVHWGQDGDVPIPSDINGDGVTDLVVYRPSSNIWYRLTPAGFESILFGAEGDRPVLADMDGDGKSDTAVFRPSTGEWWWRSSVDGQQKVIQWGQNGDIPVPADYDGDGKTDAAVFRPSTNVWYVRNSTDGSMSATQFGLAGDKPVAADYDGDGKADVAVFRPSSGIWYQMQTTSGFAAYHFGSANDIPIPNAFIY